MWNQGPSSLLVGGRKGWRAGGIPLPTLPTYQPWYLRKHTTVDSCSCRSCTCTWSHLGNQRSPSRRCRRLVVVMVMVASGPELRYLLATHARPCIFRETWNEELEETLTRFFSKLSGEGAPFRNLHTTYIPTSTLHYLHSSAYSYRLPGMWVCSPPPPQGSVQLHSLLPLPCLTLCTYY